MNKFISSRHFLKVCAFLSSLTLWFYVLSREPIERSIWFDLKYITPNGLALVDGKVTAIKVKMVGSRVLLGNLEENTEEVKVNLNKLIKKGRRKGSFSSRRLKFPIPFGVEILEIEPANFRIKLEKEIKKMVPLKISLANNLSKEVKLVKKKLVPSQVMIRGPRSILKKVSSLETSRIDLSGVSGKGERKFELIIPDDRVTLVGNPDLKMHYSIKPNKANLNLKMIKIKFLSDGRQFKSKNQFASIDVLAPDDLVAKLTKKNVRVMAEIPEKIKGKIRVKLKAELPDGIHLVSINPQYITIIVK